MIKHSEKKGLKKSLSLFEIFVLTASIFTFAYLLGNEIQVVGANVPASAAVPEVSFPTTTPGAASFTLAEPAIPGVSAAPAPSAAVASAGGGGFPYQLGTNNPAAQYATTATETTTTEASSGGYNIIEVIKGNWMDMGLNLIIAAGIWASVYFGIGALCPDCSKDMLTNLGLYLGGGYAAASILSIFIAGKGAGALLGVLGAPWGLVGMAAGFVLFLIFYRETRIDTVVFNCFPWQPKTGGADCNKCNNGPFGCTQYKCDSLGQMCKLLNAGTDQEECTYIGKNDIKSPTISAWDGPLTEGYSYVPDTARMPPDKGVIIKYNGSSDGCVPPFSRIDYGITLDEPGSCRIDTIRTDNITSMRVTLDKGYYVYNHSIFSINAGANESAAEGISYSSGGNYEVFIRCQDGNEPPNVNTGTFVFKYCVQNTPDLTAPSIKLTNPINGMPVPFGTTSTKVGVYTDKPSDCKWSHSDEDYDTMAGTMQCSKSISDINANLLYKCTTTLTGLKDQVENKFYFRCNSYPNAASSADRHKNTESYVYTLIGTQPLVIDSLSPATGAVMRDSTSSVKVTVEAKTSAGYNSGQAKCYLKESSASDNNYVKFLNTNSYQSTQDLYLTRGNYAYTIKCCDLGGNCATKQTSFTVETDFESPLVVRAYNEGGQLDIITSESAECVYDTTSCSYSFDDGIKMTSPDDISHLTDWNTNNNFYIKCSDSFGNMPAPDQCSITVRPFSGY